MVDGVVQATEHLGAQSIARDTEHEQVVRSFVEYQLDRHPGVGAAEDGRERALTGGSAVACRQADIAGVDPDDHLSSIRAIRRSIEERSERVIAVTQTTKCS